MKRSHPSSACSSVRCQRVPFSTSGRNPRRLSQPRIVLAVTGSSRARSFGVTGSMRGSMRGSLASAAQAERQPAQRRVTIGGASPVANRRDPVPRRASCWRRRRPWSSDRVAGVRRERRSRTNSNRWRSRTDRPRRGVGLLHRRWGSRSWCNSAYGGACRGGVESRCPSQGRRLDGFDCVDI